MAPSSDGVVEIRVASRKDVDAVLDLWGQARSAAASLPDDDESVLRLVEHTDDALIVAEDEGRVVGALVAAWDGWRGNMYRLTVLPA
jgi:ribosomal protein S18 acetylase RimI-like enzyme